MKQLRGTCHTHMVRALQRHHRFPVEPLPELSTATSPPTPTSLNLNSFAVVAVFVSWGTLRI